MTSVPSPTVMVPTTTAVSPSSSTTKAPASTPSFPPTTTAAIPVSPPPSSILPTVTSAAPTSTLGPIQPTNNNTREPSQKRRTKTDTRTITTRKRRYPGVRSISWEYGTSLISLDPSPTRTQTQLRHSNLSSFTKKELSTSVTTSVSEFKHKKRVVPIKSRTISKISSIEMYIITTALNPVSPETPLDSRRIRDLDNDDVKTCVTYRLTNDSWNPAKIVTKNASSSDIIFSALGNGIPWTRELLRNSRIRLILGTTPETITKPVDIELCFGHDADFPTDRDVPFRANGVALAQFTMTTFAP
eukprot:PhF_6_TR41342/c0_g1_i7/m.62734